MIYNLIEYYYYYITNYVKNTCYSLYKFKNNDMNFLLIEYENEPEAQELTDSDLELYLYDN